MPFSCVNRWSSEIQVQTNLDDRGYWNQVDTDLREHTGTDFTHGICLECLTRQLTRVHKKRKSDSFHKHPMA